MKKKDKQHHNNHQESCLKSLSTKLQKTSQWASSNVQAKQIKKVVRITQVELKNNKARVPTTPMTMIVYLTLTSPRYSIK